MVDKVEVYIDPRCLEGLAFHLCAGCYRPMPDSGRWQVFCGTCSPPLERFELMPASWR